MKTSPKQSARPSGPKGRKTATPSDDALREQLRGAGLRVTGGRVQVLRALGEIDGPISHGELAEQLGSQDLDRVTVWRILLALTEAGLVDRTDVGDHTWRFELRNTSMGHDPHPHFMCTECRTVTCLPREAVHVAPRIGRGVTEVQLKGRCERCA